MTIRKLLCLCLALMLCCAGAFAEGDLQAQLDAANAKIAELQAQVDKYYPYYAAQIVATYGEDGIIWVEEMQAEYEAMKAQYASMGIDVEGYGLADTLKKGLIESAIKDGVLLDKAAELGLDQLDEATMAEMEELTRQAFQGYVDSYLDYFYPEEEVTEEMTAEAAEYWAANGIGYEDILQAMINDEAKNILYDYATMDVAITEEDVQAEYEGMLADQQALFSDGSSFSSARTSGEVIAYVPEGYRAVKQVLIKFDDAQTARYSELQSMLSSLNAELAALETAEEGAEVRTAEEINADIAACAMETEALYAQLLPTAEKVIAEFEAGTSIEDLIAQYNADPGMMNEPTASMGYAVSDASTNWDPSFKEAAMSIEEVGGLSAPAYGSYGIYVVYYMADITPGAIALDEIRAEVEANALEAKITSTYNAAVAAWMEEANVEYFYANMGIAA